jgi:hypothetical protein
MSDDAAAAFPWRLIVGALAMVLSLALAAFAWAGRDSADQLSSTSGVETHQLTVDQAACLRFGLVTSRSDTSQLGLLLASYSTLDPGAADLLRSEIRELDEIGGDFPDADFRLVNSVAMAADADALVLARGNVITFRSVVNQRVEALSETEKVCRQVAGFDTTALDVTGDAT